MPERMRKILKICAATIGVLFLILLILGIVAYLTLRSSLPQLSGSIEVDGLKAAVSIDRDNLGVPTIEGENRRDVAQALGFLHAQERFFQMDLMRRAAAGELSELFGIDALEFDKSRRLHRFRHLSQQIYHDMQADEKTVIDAYSAGVNRGLAALKAKPFEYLLLTTKPSIWQPEDSLLVSMGLFFELQDSFGHMDLARGYMQELLPPEVYRFFVLNGSHWEATLDRSKTPFIPIPNEEAFAYLKADHPTLPLSLVSHGLSDKAQKPLGGSNHWALDGSKTVDGKALLACDMHLQLGVPTLWYRASLTYTHLDQAQHPQKITVTGATLPGTPFVIIGSNQHIAWGFTNSYIDTTDVIIISPDPTQAGFYLSPKGPLPYTIATEYISIKGQDPLPYAISSTIWGPIMPEKFLDKTTALAWIAHLPEAVNARIMDLETTKSVDAAFQTIGHIRMPLVNFMVADKHGHIGWSLIGAIPERRGFNGTVPVSFADGSAEWIGPKNTKDYPHLKDPSQGFLYTANNKVLGDQWQEFMGQSGFINSIRAYQIAHKLAETSQASAQDMLDIQLDIKAPFHERWRSLMLSTLNAHTHSASRQTLQSLLLSWDGTCSVDSAAYYWIRQFRKILSDKVVHRLLAPCFKAKPDFVLPYLDFEEPTWMIVSQQPAYLKDPRYASWQAELLACIDEMLAGHSAQDICRSTWGKHCTIDMAHPLSQAVPFLHYLLDMPASEVPGDYYVPRVQSKYEGASQRMVVSPGNEASGIFHSPAGQSGHPLSPHYRDGQAAWEQGKPAPFLPGKKVHTLKLTPALGGFLEYNGD